MKKGEITVFLSLVLAVLTGLICVLIESARLQLIRMNVEGVMDAGLNSCFGEYDQELYKRYDLLFIDSSYRGECSAGIDNVARHLSQYITVNTDYSGTGVTGEWYRENVGDSRAESYVLASDGDGEVLKAQAAGYIKKYGKIRYLNDISANKGSVEGIRINDDFIAEWDRKLRAIDSYGFPLTNPGAIVRGMVMSEDDFLKGGDLKALRFGDIPSRRTLNKGNAMSRIKRDTAGDDMFTEYLMQKSGCYTEHSDEQQLTAELEYIIYGMDSDRDNLKCVVKKLLELRESDNLHCIKSDAGKMSAAWNKAVEVVILNMPLEWGMPDPYLVGLVRDSIVYAWAYAESAVDVGRLLNNGRSPVIKSPSQVKLSLNDIMRFRSFLNDKGGQGISYKDYVGVFLEETDDRTKRMRCMDIIEGNQRCFHNGSFRIDGCVSYLEAGVKMSSGYGFSHEIKRDCIYE